MRTSLNSIAPSRRHKRRPNDRLSNRASFSPLYSGVVLIVIGLGLMIGNWVSLLTMTGGVSVILLFRILREERELLQHLGEPYKNYMQRTKRLIPFLF
jgi:protein-S-isoprenylcysteine O-methyltransferase Ste14